MTGLSAYAAAFPMAPLGGLFILPVAGCVLAGGALPRHRLRLVFGGFALGTAALTLFGGRLLPGLGAPSALQVGSLVVAIVGEFAAFALAMPRLRTERGRFVATLAIVGGHFLVMVPAFGPIAAGLGLVCLLNAAAGWRNAAVRETRLWLIDGALKLAGAALLLSTAPVLA